MKKLHAARYEKSRLITAVLNITRLRSIRTELRFANTVVGGLRSTFGARKAQTGVYTAPGWTGRPNVADPHPIEAGAKP